ncbi:cupin domain-containing protein [candidate division WOR-3 bacterium]|nr:cupin domain-containing protein [candidate division WOR-3 bacterium]
MGDFPVFMKNALNKIPVSTQNTKDIEGFYFEGKDGSQMAFWTSFSDRTSEKHMHDFDEYMTVVNGQYTVYVEGEKTVLNPGDELFIPKGKEQWGECLAGTRTIHCFGGKRINPGKSTETENDLGK